MGNFDPERYLPSMPEPGPTCELHTRTYMGTRTYMYMYTHTDDAGHASKRAQTVQFNKHSAAVYDLIAAKYDLRSKERLRTHSTVF